MEITEIDNCSISKNLAKSFTNRRFCGKIYKYVFSLMQANYFCISEIKNEGKN